MKRHPEAVNQPEDKPRDKQPTGGVVVSEVVRSPPTASKQRLQRAAMHQLPKTDFPIVKLWCVIRLNDKKPSRDQTATKLDVSLDLNKECLDEPNSMDCDTSPPVPKKKRGRPKKLTTARSNVCGVSPPQFSPTKLQPPSDDSSTPKEPSNNLLKEIEIDLKRMPPKQRQVRRKITLPAQITPASSSQLQEHETSAVSKENVTGQPQEQEINAVSKEKVEVTGHNNIEKLLSVEEPSGPKKSIALVSEVETDSKKGLDVVEFVGVTVSAKKSFTTEEEKPSAVKNPSVGEPSMEEPPVNEPSVDDPLLKEPKELSFVEESSMKDCHSSQNKNVCRKTKRNKDTKEAKSKTKDVGQSSDTSVLSVHAPGLRWERTEKRKLVMEAKQWGIRPTARRHNMSSSTLSSWMTEDFCGDLKRNKKRLNCGRSSRYDRTGEVALKDWVIQKMVKKERVSYKELWKKAMELIVPCNPNFRATLGWIRRFLQHQKLNLRDMIHASSKKQRMPIPTLKS